MDGELPNENATEIGGLKSEINQLRSRCDSLERKIDVLTGSIDQRIEGALDTFTIMGGQGIMVTGQGRGMTITKQTGAPFQASWTIVCNPGTSTMTGTLVIPGL